MSTKGQDVQETPIEFLMEFLKQLSKEAAMLDNLPDSMRTLIDQSRELTCGLHYYPSQMSTHISPAAKLLAKKTEEIDYAGLYEKGLTGNFKFFKEMSSDVLQGEFACNLKMLIRMCGAKRVLEIGTFTGFAALNMAEVLPRDGIVVTVEKMGFFARYSREFLDTTAVKDKVEVRHGCAIDELNACAQRGEQFDFIFVDAIKTQYKDYLALILDNNILAPKGTLVFDNTIYKGTAYMKKFPNELFARGGPVVHAFNQAVMDDSRIDQVLLPIRDGVTIIRRVNE
ncbi:uncharacterized protein [Diadema setosum]|uniref:uncharacterized protein n=1 Tax=Diadema setosum TaxID=31175 RepID=UPI003B3AA03D